MVLGVGLSCKECCCACGQFCSGGECGDTLSLQGTTEGAEDDDCESCASLNAVFGLLYLGSMTAIAWNSSSPGSIGRPTPAIDAKAGTKVCQWSSSDVASACSTPLGASVEDVVVSIYFGTDDKWHACVRTEYIDGFGTFELSGDAEFPDGGGPIDCTAFNLSVPLSIDTGTPFYCVPPTDFLIENAA